MSEPTKRCSFCGEEILAVAIKCKHCGSMLSDLPSGVAPSTREQSLQTPSSVPTSAKKSSWLMPAAWHPVTKIAGAIFMLFFILVVIVVFGVVFEDVNRATGTRTQISGPPKPPESAYAMATPLDYRKATLVQIGQETLLSFDGKIDQIVGNNGAMIATKRNSFVGFAGDSVY